MNTRLFWIWAFLLPLVTLFPSCAGDDKVPSGIIPGEKMEKILWDMIQADQYAAIYLVKDSSKVNVKMETLKLYEQVFHLHNVTREEFRKSFQFYLDHPDLTRPVFDSLLAMGNRVRSDSYRSPQPAIQPSPIIQPVTTPAKIPPGIPPAAKRGLLRLDSSGKRLDSSGKKKTRQMIES